MYGPMWGPMWNGLTLDFANPHIWENKFGVNMGHVVMLVNDNYGSHDPYKDLL